MVSTYLTSTLTLYAVFDAISFARKAVGALLDYGVRAEDISFVSGHSKAQEEQRADDDGMTLAENDARETPHLPVKNGLSTTTPGDAASGATKGAGIGLGVGVLAALASLFVPGFGLVAGGGALAVALAGTVGATAAGAVAGGITGYLKDQGVPDEPAHRFNEAYETGDTILAVHSPSNGVDQATIEWILNKYQARYVSAFDDRADSALAHEKQTP